MQTQINCPKCRAPINAQIYNIVDAQRTPELKQMLLAGALNVAQCQNCGTATQLSVPMGYHDAENQLFMVYVPMELNLPMAEQEKLIGQMTRAITEGIPKDQFKAYLLQPQNILTMQTFMEKVYATEGITPEMLKRQRDQAQLLQQLAGADREKQTELIAEKQALIDETFFAMLAANLQSAEQSQAPQANQTFIKLTNLQARLLTMTEAGTRLEKRQLALRDFQQAAQQRGGLTLELFLEYLLKYAPDEPTLDAIIEMGQQGIRYELFALITDRIEQSQDPAEKEQLTALREKLLGIYEAMQEEAQSMLKEAEQTLNHLLAANDLEKAIIEQANHFDDSFLYFLSGQMQQAENLQDSRRLSELERIHSAIMAEAEKQMPPELRLLNELLSTDDESVQRRLIDQLPAEARPEFGALLKMMGGEFAKSDPKISKRIENLQALLQ